MTTAAATAVANSGAIAPASSESGLAQQPAVSLPQHHRQQLQSQALPLSRPASRESSVQRPMEGNLRHSSSGAANSPGLCPRSPVPVGLPRPNPLLPRHRVVVVSPEPSIPATSAASSSQRLAPVSPAPQGRGGDLAGSLDRTLRSMPTSSSGAMRHYSACSLGASSAIIPTDGVSSAPPATAQPVSSHHSFATHDAPGACRSEVPCEVTSMSGAPSLPGPLLPGAPCVADPAADQGPVRSCAGESVGTASVALVACPHSHAPVPPAAAAAVATVRMDASSSGGKLSSLSVPTQATEAASIWGDCETPSEARCSQESSGWGISAHSGGANGVAGTGYTNGLGGVGGGAGSLGGASGSAASASARGDAPISSSLLKRRSLEDPCEQESEELGRAGSHPEEHEADEREAPAVPGGGLPGGLAMREAAAAARSEAVHRAAEAAVAAAPPPSSTWSRTSPRRNRDMLDRPRSRSREILSAERQRSRSYASDASMDEYAIASPSSAVIGRNASVAETPEDAPQGSAVLGTFHAVSEQCRPVTQRLHPLWQQQQQSPWTHQHDGCETCLQPPMWQEGPLEEEPAHTSLRPSDQEVSLLGSSPQVEPSPALSASDPTEPELEVATRSEFATFARCLPTQRAQDSPGGPCRALTLEADVAAAPDLDDRSQQLSVEQPSEPADAGLLLQQSYSSLRTTCTGQVEELSRLQGKRPLLDEPGRAADEVCQALQSSWCHDDLKDGVETAAFVHQTLQEPAQQILEEEHSVVMEPPLLPTTTTMTTVVSSSLSTTRELPAGNCMLASHVHHMDVGLEDTLPRAEAVSSSQLFCTDLPNDMEPHLPEAALSGVIAQAGGCWAPPAAPVHLRALGHAQSLPPSLGDGLCNGLPPHNAALPASQNGQPVVLSSAEGFLQDDVPHQTEHQPLNHLTSHVHSLQAVQTAAASEAAAAAAVAWNAAEAAARAAAAAAAVSQTPIVMTASEEPALQCAAASQPPAAGSARGPLSSSSAPQQKQQRPRSAGLTSTAAASAARAARHSVSGAGVHRGGPATTPRRQASSGRAATKAEVVPCSTFRAYERAKVATTPRKSAGAPASATRAPPTQTQSTAKPRPSSAPKVGSGGYAFAVNAGAATAVATTRARSGERRVSTGGSGVASATGSTAGAPCSSQRFAGGTADGHRRPSLGGAAPGKGASVVTRAAAAAQTANVQSSLSGQPAAKAAKQQQASMPGTSRPRCKTSTPMVTASAGASDACSLAATAGKRLSLTASVASGGEPRTAPQQAIEAASYSVASSGRFQRIVPVAPELELGGTAQHPQSHASSVSGIAVSNRAHGVAVTTAGAAVRSAHLAGTSVGVGVAFTGAGQPLEQMPEQPLDASPNATASPALSQATEAPGVCPFGEEKILSKASAQALGTSQAASGGDEGVDKRAVIYLF